MGRYARRKDLNHNEVAQAIRDASWNWSDCYFAGNGLPDGFATSACLPAPITVGVEIKTPGEKLTESERKFHMHFAGNMIIADSGPCAVIQLSEIRARHLGIKYV